MPPSFIYFDLGNVLVSFDHPRGARQVAELTGADEDLVRQLGFSGELELKLENGQLSSREYYDIFCRETGTSPDYDAMELAGSAIFDLLPRTTPLVMHLHAAGYRLGILSNTRPSHWEYCTGGRYAQIPTLFEHAVLSYEVGVMKPAAKIYQVAIEKAGAEPGEIFFTDDLEKNVEGALAAGLDAVLFTSAEQLAEDLRSRGVRFNY
jgi:putative hydrolase of the HAD superfamily